MNNFVLEKERQQKPRPQWELGIEEHSEFLSDEIVKYLRRATSKSKLQTKDYRELIKQKAKEMLGDIQTEDFKCNFVR